MPYMELELLTLSFVLLFFCPDWTLCSNIYLMWLLCVYLIMAEFILLTLPGLFFYNVLVLCLYCYFCIRIELFVQNMHVYTMCACNFQRIVITVYSYENIFFLSIPIDHDLSCYLHFLMLEIGTVLRHMLMHLVLSF